MFLNVSSSRMRSIIDTGIAAAPVTATRNDERSKFARLGSLRMERNNVGGPGNIDTFSVAMRANTFCTSNTGSGIIVAPFKKLAMIPAL